MEGLKKPDPQIFKKALNQLQVTPSESIFVGDHPENDVKTAKNVGMKSIWKKDFQWDNVDADFVVDDLAELFSIIHKVNDDSILFN